VIPLSHFDSKLIEVGFQRVIVLGLCASIWLRQTDELVRQLRLLLEQLIALPESSMPSVIWLAGSPSQSNRARERPFSVIMKASLA